MDLSVFLSILSEFSNLLGVPQQPPSSGRNTRYPPPPPSNYRPGVPTTNYVRNNNNKFPTVDSGYFRKYFPKKASSFTPYVTYTKQYSRPNTVTYTRPWASSSASSSGSGSSTSFSSSGNGGSYARATSHSGKQYNPYDKLFNYWKPTQWKPQSQTSRFSFKSGCSSCVTLYDAISADDIKNFTAETACVAYVEQVFGEVKKPKDLEKEVAALQKKELHDPSPLILQCCYREFKHKFLPKDEAKLAEYPEPKGFEKGRSCKDVVQSLLKLMKGDYEQPAKPAESETKNASKTADPKTQNDVKLAPELVNESFP